jgi:hypothetical protein
LSLYKIISYKNVLTRNTKFGDTQIRRSFIFLGTCIGVNAALVVLGLSDIFDGWPLYQIPLFEIAWLYGLGRSLSWAVEGKANEFAVMPNACGWALIVLGTLITISAYAYVGHWLLKSRDGS